MGLRSIQQGVIAVASHHLMVSGPSFGLKAAVLLSCLAVTDEV
jgi:hypothetical protein